MIKYFTTVYGSDVVSNIKKLNKDYPGFHFKSGMHKDKKGIYAIKDLDIKEYGEGRKSATFKDSIFFPPKETPSDTQKFISEISDSLKTDKIKVTLTSGFDIAIVPATAEPRKIYLSLIGDGEDSGEQLSEYGKLAYEVYDELAKGDIKIDQKVMRLITLGINRSYKNGIDLFNWLGVIGTDDIADILYATLGIDEKLLKKDSLSS
jgi:hypothetical protein